MKSYKCQAILVVGALLLFMSNDAHAQFTAQWLDVGSYHSTYQESGARHESSSVAHGMEFPAIRNESSHGWAKAFWIGVKDWTDESGQSWPIFTSRIGPRDAGVTDTFPVENRLISRSEETRVQVDGADSFDNVAILDEVDPGLPADRMVHNVHNMSVGVTVTRKAYAYVNQFQDNYHIIEYEYCNTGNVDGDEEIELQGQNLKDVYFFRVHRWRGNALEAWVTGSAQTWGKYSMIDVVGDGHATYPVDFTIQYLWPGFNPDFTQYNNLGGALFDDSHWLVSEGDSRRLAGGDFTFRGVLHADTSPTNSAFDRGQPSSMGFMDQDEVLTSAGSPHADYYELGILTRDNPNHPNNAGCTNCSTRMTPHYADRVQIDGQFWNPTGDASSGKQGGHAPTTGYGPYQMAFGECVNIAVTEGVAGISEEARQVIGAAYVDGGGDDAATIPFDANGDGVIDATPFDYSVAYSGGESLTKNEWVMTARDSVFRTMEKSTALYAASNGMTTYPIVEAPHAPISFNVDGRPNQIELTWEPATTGPSITGWEVYRAADRHDNLTEQPDGTIGYELLATLAASATSYNDASAIRGTNYFYYIQAVGQSNSNDANAINGTPGGAPLKSSRYLTQTYLPVNLKRPPYGATNSVKDSRVVPNPINLGSDGSVRFFGSAIDEDSIVLFNIPGDATIKIYTELGELVKVVEHTDGSGDERINLTTNSRQLFAAGIYLIHITDNDAGDSVIRKLVVIR